MKKNTKATATAALRKTGKNAPTSVPGIQALNDAYKSVERSQAAFTVACKKNKSCSELSKLNKALVDALAAFDKIRAKLPQVKFDYRTGEYLLAGRDDMGCETYHVAVTKILEAIYEVRARTEEEAKEAAIEKSSFSKKAAYAVDIDPPITAEIVSILA